MKELDRVKNVEASVARKVRKREREAEKRIAEARDEGEQMVQDTAAKASGEEKARLERVRMKAERKAAKILAEANDEVKRLRSLSRKNKSKAVELIIKELGG